MKAKKRANVKSGCRTCKVRKVKCDEGRPVCQRCLSTGRVCDGYGIWGGGGNNYGQRQRPLAVVPSPNIYSSTEDSKCYEWFRLRTSNKLPASYKSGFWDTLIFQASFTEPAIWHAALALGSFHREAVITAGVAGDGKEAKQGQLMLQHVSKSIEHLQRHFKANNQVSYRIALVACVLFATLDLLRGHVQQARVHLNNGRNILMEMKLLFPRDKRTLYIRKGRHETDDMLSEAWARLDFQYQLWQVSGGNYEAGTIVMEDSYLLEESSFGCILQAWRPLQRYLKEAMRLSELARCHQEQKNHADTQDSKQHGGQGGLIFDLSRWLEKWEKFSHLHLRSSFEERKANWLLRCFHAMAVIMAKTCTDVGDEQVYDLETPNFVCLLIHLIKLRQSSSEASSALLPVVDQLLGISGSVVDLGTIQPLFYVATKCRVHRLRLQAIRLLESSAHREGLLESRLAGRVARKIMVIEERDRFANEHMCDDFTLLEYPVDPTNLSPRLPPREQRISLVEVELLGEPMDTVLLRYTMNSAVGDGVEFITAYKVQSDQWEELAGLRDHRFTNMD